MEGSDKAEVYARRKSMGTVMSRRTLPGNGGEPDVFLEALTKDIVLLA